MSIESTAPYTGREAGTLLRIDAVAESVMRSDAAASYPYECCGFFFGRMNGNERLIQKAMPIHNAAVNDRERRFAISPRDFLHAERESERLGLDLLGVYHSHPDHPALPSVHDQKSAIGGFSYIIVEVRSGRPMRMRSWTLNAERRFDEEEIDNVLAELVQIFRYDKQRLS